MSELLSVQLKKGSDVDLTKPFKNLISSLYSTSERPEDFSMAINELNKLRSQALAKNLEKSLPSLDLLYRYYDQISALETKIPPQEIQISFKWRDAFDKGSLFGGKVNLSVSSLSYEKACVLFNIAALQSQIGGQGRISDTDEELKSAAKLFQSASGIFNHLKSATAVMGGQEPTPDLNADTLSALSSLMLAQAQEIFVLKAVQDKMKDIILSKICIQAEDMYADALRLMQKDNVKHLWDREWLPNVAGKQAAYSALAQFFQSQVCGSKKLVGEQITRLNVCLDTLKQAQTRMGNTNFFADYQSKANRLLTESKKDNDFIYHERIPDVSSLAAIDKVASCRLAKSIVVPEQFSSHFKDLFDALVPVVIQQAVAACDVRKNEVVNTKVGQLREATQLLNSILVSLNLPAALEDSSSSGSVPQSLKEKASIVAEAGGFPSLQELITNLPELVQRNKEILDEAERLIREEEESDNQLRSQLREKWTRTSSDKLNSTFKVNGTRYREIINNALSADQIVREKFTKHREAIEMLSGGENGLSNHIPRDDTNASNTGSLSAKEALKQLMYEVENLKSKREVLEADIKDASFDMKGTFLNALAQDGAINEPALSLQAIGNTFGPLENRVKESLERQETLVAAVQENSDEYFGKKNGNEGSRREQVMKQIAEGFDAFNDLQNHAKEGTKFYNDLTQLLLQYQTKISDYCFARKTEKEELLKDVTRDASSSSGQPTPPARPPPPTGIQPPQQQQPQNVPVSAPPAYNPQMQQQQPYAPQPQPMQAGGIPYPQQPYGAMPMPFGHPQHQVPYQQMVYTPMPQSYNPYPTYPLPSHYNYPVQPMGYPPQQQPPPNYQQQQQYPPPQQ